MLKEWINYIAQPKFSFTLFIIFYFIGIKKIQTVGSKKFGKIAGIIILIIFFYSASDPNFFFIITWPDNVPILILLSTVFFFTWFSIHKAVENDKRIDEGLPPIEGTPENREKVWAWPNLVYTELFAIIATTIFLIVWSICLKAPLEEPANPTWAPNPAKAPWYFLGLQEMLVYFDPWMAGVVLPGLIVVGLLAIPYIDTNPKGNGYYTFKERKMAITAFCFGWLALWVFLIVIGTFMRGPNWTFYGPFEVWDFHKVVAESNINLSEIVWVKMLGTNMPSSIFVREIVGIITVIAYFAGSTWLITRKWGQSLMEKCGAPRYYIFVFLLLSMGSLPIKMYLRWLFNLKYIVAMPEWELNL